MTLIVYRDSLCWLRRKLRNYVIYQLCSLYVTKYRLWERSNFGNVTDILIVYLFTSAYSYDEMCIYSVYYTQYTFF